MKRRAKFKPKPKPKSFDNLYLATIFECSSLLRNGRRKNPSGWISLELGMYYYYCYLTKHFEIVYHFSKYAKIYGNQNEYNTYDYYVSFLYVSLILQIAVLTLSAQKPVFLRAKAEFINVSLYFAFQCGIQEYSYIHTLASISCCI